MKPLLFLCGLSALFFMACSSAADKFEGHWTPIAGSKVTNSNMMWLKKVDKESFVLVFYKWERTDTIKLYYNRNEDLLVGKFKFASRTIKYLKDSDHIIVAPTDPGSKSFTVELERVKDNL